MISTRSNITLSLQAAINRLTRRHRRNRSYAFRYVDPDHQSPGDIAAQCLIGFVGGLSILLYFAG